jgi:hypothetical protein
MSGPANHTYKNSQVDPKFILLIFICILKMHEKSNKHRPILAKITQKSNHARIPKHPK